VHPLVPYLVAYLVGSVLFGPLVARRAGVDLYENGSGNPGATNVERLVGHRAALLVLALDAGKGALVVLGHSLASHARLVDGDPATIAFAVVFGHCVPALAPRRGGKGVATALGAIAALDALAGGAFVVTYVAIRKLSGYGSVASLAALTLSVAVASVARPVDAGSVALLAIVGLVFVRHADNFSRLVRGEEPTVGGAPPDADAD